MFISCLGINCEHIEARNAINNFRSVWARAYHMSENRRVVCCLQQHGKEVLWENASPFPCVSLQMFWLGLLWCDIVTKSGLENTGLISAYNSGHTVSLKEVRQELQQRSQRGTAYLACSACFPTASKTAGPGVALSLLSHEPAPPPPVFNQENTHWLAVRPIWWKSFLNYIPS